VKQPYTANLFWSQDPDLYTFIEQRKREVSDWIHNLQEAELADEAVTERLLQQFELDPLDLDIENAEVVEQGSKRINIRHDHRFMTAYFDADEFGEEPYANGHYITFGIPYSGSALLLTLRPQTYPNRPFSAEIHPSEVRVTIEDAVAFTEESLSKQQRQVFRVLKGCAESAKSYATQFNGWLENEGANLIEKRRSALEGQQSLVQQLGFKVRKRQEQPGNVSAPAVRKKVSSFKQLKASNQSQVLDMAVYEEILSICRNMARVMELSPRAFVAIREEDLRFHFLVQLNAVFEGQATGETFNLSGKTDILIKHEGQNLFIAECKYWTGEKDYEAAIDLN